MFQFSKEKLEQDIWTSFVAFPNDHVVLVATDRNYLAEVLARLQARTASAPCRMICLSGSMSIPMLGFGGCGTTTRAKLKPILLRPSPDGNPRISRMNKQLDS